MGQLPIEGCQVEVLAQRALQVRRVVGAQSRALGKRADRLEIQQGAVDPDSQAGDALQCLQTCIAANALPALRDEQGIRNFQTPDGRCPQIEQLHLVEKIFAESRALALEKPSERQRGVDHQRHQYRRPALISSGIVVPGPAPRSLPTRQRRISSISARLRARSLSSAEAGTSFATALPRRVMVTVSPASTLSSSSASFVFASKDPTFIRRLRFPLSTRQPVGRVPPSLSLAQPARNS